MNVQTLNGYVEDFNELVIESGFRRDVTDYNTSIQTLRGNVVGLKDMARTVHKHLEQINDSTLPDELLRLLPGKKSKPFTSKGYMEKIADLLDDKTIQQDQFFSSLVTILNSLGPDIERDADEIETLGEFLKPYTLDESERLAEENKAVFSVIFRDEKTVSELGEFSKILRAWNITLPLYHQLVTHTSPEKIELVEVQNGSIDIVINIDFDVALNLVDLFSMGFKAYGAYLLHKKLIQPMMEGYVGNAKLKNLDEQKERFLLENINERVAELAHSQAKQAKAKGAKPDNPDKIVERVASLVTAHIVRGNAVKILALPKPQQGEEASVENAKRCANDLSKAANAAKKALSELPVGATQLLLEHYGNPVDEEGDAAPAKEAHKKSKKAHP